MCIRDSTHTVGEGLITVLHPWTKYFPIPSVDQKRFCKECPSVLIALLPSSKQQSLVFEQQSKTPRNNIWWSYRSLLILLKFISSALCSNACIELRDWESVHVYRYVCVFWVQMCACMCVYVHACAYMCMCVSVCECTWIYSGLNF